MKAGCVYVRARTGVWVSACVCVNVYEPFSRNRFHIIFVITITVQTRNIIYI